MTAAAAPTRGPLGAGAPPATCATRTTASSTSAAGAAAVEAGALLRALEAHGAARASRRTSSRTTTRCALAKAADHAGVCALRELRARAPPPARPPSCSPTSSPSACSCPRARAAAAGGAGARADGAHARRPAIAERGGVLVGVHACSRARGARARAARAHARRGRARTRSRARARARPRAAASGSARRARRREMGGAGAAPAQTYGAVLEACRRAGAHRAALLLGRRLWDRPERVLDVASRCSDRQGLGDWRGATRSPREAARAAMAAPRPTRSAPDRRRRARRRRPPEAALATLRVMGRARRRGVGAGGGADDSGAADAAAARARWRSGRARERRAGARGRARGHLGVRASGAHVTALAHRRDARARAEPNAALVLVGRLARERARDRPRARLRAERARAATPPAREGRRVARGRRGRRRMAARRHGEAAGPLLADAMPTPRSTIVPSLGAGGASCRRRRRRAVADGAAADGGDARGGRRAERLHLRRGDPPGAKAARYGDGAAARDVGEARALLVRRWARPRAERHDGAHGRVGDVA